MAIVDKLKNKITEAGGDVTGIQNIEEAVNALPASGGGGGNGVLELEGEYIDNNGTTYIKVTSHHLDTILEHCHISDPTSEDGEGFAVLKYGWPDYPEGNRYCKAGTIHVGYVGSPMGAGLAISFDGLNMDSISTGHQGHSVISLPYFYTESLIPIDSSFDEVEIVFAISNRSLVLDGSW